MKRNVIIGIVVIIAAIAIIAAAFVLLGNDKDKDSIFDDTSPGLHVYALDGVDFYVQIPEQVPDEQYGMVIDVHGAGMTAEQQNAGSNLREIGPKYGYVVVQPQAPEPNYLMDFDTDGIVLEMIGLLVDELDIDENHIHMTGFSAGGYFTWRFIRDNPDILASAAPAAAAGIVGWGCTFTEEDMPSEQIPMMYMIGTKDGPYAASLTVRDNILAAYAMDTEVVVSQDSTYKHIRYTGANGMVFEYVEHDYASSTLNAAGNPAGGHCMPGAEKDDFEDILYRYTCDGPTSFNWGEEVMKFFIANPKA